MILALDGVDVDAVVADQRGRDVVLGGQGFEAHRNTSAPPATRVVTRLAVSVVTCRQAPIQALERALLLEPLPDQGHPSLLLPPPLKGGGPWSARIRFHVTVRVRLLARHRPGVPERWPRSRRALGHHGPGPAGVTILPGRAPGRQRREDARQHPFEGPDADRAASRTSSWVGSLAATFVMHDMARTRSPRAAATASGTWTSPTASAPRRRSISVSAGVSYDGPDKAA